MYKYYVNKNRQDSKDGLHNEVHREGCRWMPKDFIDLGYHFSCKGAMKIALVYYPETADGCIVCCNECHNG
jgi:hypothetical protein